MKLEFMQTDIPIKQIMSTNLQTVAWDTFVIEVKKIFSEKGIHHMPVIGSDGQLAGIISTTDLERSKIGAGLFSNPKREEYSDAILSDIPAYELMSKDLEILSETDSIRSAYNILKLNKIRAVIITDAEKNLVGIVTPLDLLDYFFNG